MNRLIVYTSSALDILILHEQKCFQRLSKSTAWISELVWKPVPDGGLGNRERPTAECAALVNVVLPGSQVQTRLITQGPCKIAYRQVKVHVL